MSKWHKGPPPSVGWWPASKARNDHFLRWWNGSTWSDAAHCSVNSSDAAWFADHGPANQTNIEWTDRPDSWPEWSKT